MGSVERRFQLYFIYFLGDMVPNLQCLLWSSFNSFFIAVPWVKAFNLTVQECHFLERFLPFSSIIFEARFMEGHR